MTKRLTPVAVENAKPATTRLEIPDGGCRGLYLVIQPSGSKSWALRYRFAGKPCKLTLGPALVLQHGEAPPENSAIDQPLTLADARRLATEALSKVERGINPAKEKSTQIEAAHDAAATREADGVEALAAQFIERYAKIKNKSWQQVDAIFRREILPRWRGKTVHEIEREDVEDLIDAIAADRPIMANRTLAAVRKWFSWMAGRSKGGRKAVLKARLRTAPCLGVEAPGQERSRERTLTNAEIAQLWSAADQEDEPFKGFVKVLLLTGQRRGEVAGMRHDELDLDRAVWSLPGARTKNARPHTVPLPSQVVAILKATPPVASEYIFSATGDGPIAAFAKLKSRLEQRMATTSRWTLHDVRRSAATGMVDIGVQPHIVEVLLNHSTGHRAGVAGTYNRSLYSAEKAEALQRWADYVDRIVTGAPAKVVPIRGGGGYK
jgi:integrase